MIALVAALTGRYGDPRMSSHHVIESIAPGASMKAVPPSPPV
jgi:hypothetical protein